MRSLSRLSAHVNVCVCEERRVKSLNRLKSFLDV
jgi:hypothetical protein